jgi:inorganic triphosphatase YgiF
MALLISSEDAQAVAGQIARLASIAAYRLVPQDTRVIHDLYLDTPDRALRAQKIALRIREIGTAHRITLKGLARPAGWGVVEHLEIEHPWSESALALALEELKKRGIALPRQRPDFADHPLDVMADLGLDIVQDRETRRRVRNVVPAGDENGPLLAEMAIDAVVYRLGGRGIGHREVEIEVKEGGNPAVAEAVGRGLIAMYGPALRVWPYGKLGTGQAVEELLSAGALEALLDDEGNLGPIAYRKIEEYLLKRQNASY